MKLLDSIFCFHDWECIKEREGESLENVVALMAGCSYFVSFLYKCKKCGKLKRLVKRY